MMTSFYLIALPDYVRGVRDGHKVVRTAPLAWILAFEGRFPPERFGLAKGYEPNQHGVDKSWDLWPQALAGERFDLYATASSGVSLQHPWDLDAWVIATR